MIEKPHTQIIINEKKIRPNDIYDINLYTSIWETLPKLSFKLNDPTGKLLAELNIVEGALVILATIDTSYHNESVTLEENPENDEEIAQRNRAAFEDLYFVEPFDTDFFPTPFVIKEIFTGFEGSNPNAGFIQIECVQSWDLFVNPNQNGYNGKISEIIKKVLSDTIDNAKIDKSEINGESSNNINYLNDSSDDGKTIRHSAGLVDIDFIEQRLLPYLNIQEKPGYFFIDAFRRPHISNFDLMFSSKPEVLLYNTKNINNEQAEHLGNLIQSSGCSEFIPISDIVCEFGQNKNYSNILCTYMTGRTLNIIESKNSIIQSSFISEGHDDAITPFNINQYYSVPASRFSLSPNFVPADDKLLLKNNAFKDADRNIVAKIKVNYISEKLRVGDTIEYYTPYLGGKIHWLNGRWVVGAITYQILKDSSGKDIQNSMELTVIRKFIPWKSPEKSSIENAGALL